MTEDQTKRTTNFIKEIIDADLLEGKNDSRVQTRFPPEPNGYLHIGHAKSIVLNFGLADEYQGHCNLRFDDTNPVKEEEEYIQSIIEDVCWLGYDWGDRLYFASDYFNRLYELAEQLVKSGKAFVCDLTGEQIREYRGTLTEPGKNSPFRDRPIKENLDLLRRMRTGEFPDGSRVLRAKIDMTSPNLNMRDPVIYRILHTEHPRTKDAWCIYPMYDWAHGLEDSIEKITHSLCTLEFEDHRPLYDWYLIQLGVYRPQQIEFARLNLGYTVLSKRKLLQLVQEDRVTGWDDPRMPTISGLRRRGYTPESIRRFCERVGIAKKDNIADIALLEYYIREDLNKRAPRVMAVLNPLKIIIDNYPAGQVEQLEAINNPEDPEDGTRKIPFSRELYIEQEDFQEEPHRKFFRLAPGREVRLKHAYIIKCEEIVKDELGNILEIHCSYDPQTKSGGAQSNRKVKGTLHWVSVAQSIKAEVRLYDRLFAKANPHDTEEGADFKSNLNPQSLEIISARVEPGLSKAQPGDRFQFLRRGYFCVDIKDSTPEKLVFNRTVPLRDSWARIEKMNARQKQ